MCLTRLLSDSIVADQWAVLRRFLAEPRLLTAVCIFWVERVGGGLGAPVVPFFALELGLAAPDIGLLSTIALCFLMLPAPLYGWIQDRHGPMFTIMVSSGCCALGCGLRGFAQGFYWLAVSSALGGFGGGNLISTISAHVATETPPSQRALALSALAVQGSTLRILGQALYVPWDAALRGGGLGERMLRFRVTLSVCTFFCAFGVVQLCLNGHHLRRGSHRAAAVASAAADDGDADSGGSTEEAQGGGMPRVASSDGLGAELSDGGGRTTELVTLVKGADADADDDAAAAVASVRGGGGGGGGGGCGGCGGGGGGGALGGRVPAGVLPCLLALYLRAACEALATILWPLFMRAHFGYDERGYARLLFLSTLLSTVAVAAFPRLQRRVGDADTVAVLGATAAAALGLAFVVQSDAAAARTLHAALALLSIASLAALEPCLRALASTLVPHSLQGRSFAALNVASALGAATAGVVGTRLYQFSLDGDGGASLPPLLRGGALPTVLAAPCLLAVVLHVRGAVRAVRPRGGRMRV